MVQLIIDKFKIEFDGQSSIIGVENVAVNYKVLEWLIDTYDIFSFEQICQIFIRGCLCDKFEFSKNLQKKFA